MAGETRLRTLLVAAAVALACSALVSVAVLLLRPVQQSNALAERNRAILDAAGRLPAAADERAIADAYQTLDVRVVDLQAQTLGADGPVADPRLYDHWALPDDSPYVLDRPGTAAPGQPSQLPRYIPVYLVWSGSSLQRLVLPLHGPGMWSTLYAYLALEPDFRTIAAVVVYRHGETPGIGDRIEDPKWLRSWHGKQVYDARGDVAFDVTRSAGQSPYQVDLISGASVTSDNLGDVVRFWMGPQGYAPLLARLRGNGSALSPP